MRITARLTALFFLTAIVPTAIVGYLGYDIGKRTILKETTDHLVSINILKSRELERWINDGKSSIEQLAQRPLVRRYSSVMASSHDRSDPAYIRAHRSIVEDHFKPRLKYGIFTELFVMCPREGHISASTDEKQDGKLRDTRRYFIEGKNRTYVEGSYYSPALERPAMTVSTPVKAADGNLVAVLAGRFNLVELSEIMALRSDKSGTLDTYLVNTFNFFVSEPRFGEDYVLKKAVRTNGVEAGLSGKEGFGFYKNYRGVPVIGAYKWLPEFRMCIITEIEQAEALEPVTQLAWVITAGVLIVLMTAGFLGIFFARTISRPLIQLAAGAGEIGSGNLEYRVDIKNKDELGDLARATNEMAAKLHETHTSVENLQKEITERMQAEEALLSLSARQEALLSAIPDIIMEVDNNKVYTWANQPGIEFFGEDVIGKEAAYYFEGEQETYNQVKPVFNGNESIIYVESWQRRKDGEKRLLAWWCRALKDDDGNVTGALSTARDLTAYKRAEEEVARTAQEWQTTFDSTNNAIWILDKDQRVLRSNKIAERFFHRPCGEFIGKHCWEIVHGTEQPIPECPLLRARKSLSRERMELQVGEVWFEIIVDPILDADGRYAGAVHVVSDITDRKRAEEQLNEQLEELRRWNKAVKGREMRILNLKSEVNKLLVKAGLPVKYSSAEEDSDWPV